MTNRGLLCLSVAAVALAAQTSLAQAAAGNGDTTLGEVVVTAQKVETTVQKTPIAIQTISGDQLVKAGVLDAKDLNRIVPGLNVLTAGPGGSSFFIRGVGTGNDNAYGDAGLTFSLDQTYFSRPFGPDMTFFDIARVEVLKGPQGTLYGRNATGGAINVITNKPTFDGFHADAGVEVGNYDLYKFNGDINIPISDQLAVRGAFQTVNHNGYNTDGYNDANTVAGRLHVLWKPATDVSLLISGNYMHDRGMGPGLVPYADNKFSLGNAWTGAATPAGVAYVLANTTAPSGPITTVVNAGIPTTGVTALPGTTLPASAPAILANPGPGPLVVRPNGFTDLTVADVSADLEWNLGWANLSILPSYLKTNDKEFWYNGPTAIYQTQNADQTSVEARLTAPRGQRLQWILGVYYLTESQGYNFFGQGSPPSILIHNLEPDVSDTSYAPFGQATFSVTDRLRITGGIRYTDERKNSINALSEGLGYPLQIVNPNGSLTTIPPSASPFFVAGANTTLNFTATTYRAGAEYDLTSHNLLYANYSTGFHAGGIQPGAPVTRPLCNIPATGAPTGANFANCDLPATYQPETLDAYALGSKNRFFDNRVQLNVEAFYWTYHNLQVAHLSLINPSVTGFRTDNAGQATLYGLDADASWLVTRNDLISANLLYNETRYDQYRTINKIGPIISVTDLSGRQLVNAPRWSGNVSYQHTFDLGDAGIMVPAVHGEFQSAETLGYSTAPQPNISQGGFWKTDLTLSYSLPGARWNVTGYVRNLEDKATVSATPGGNQSNTPSTGSPWVLVSPPRTYGVIVQAKF